MNQLFDECKIIYLLTYTSAYLRIRRGITEPFFNLLLLIFQVPDFNEYS